MQRRVSLARDLKRLLREKDLAEIHLLTAIAQKYARLSVSDRIRKIKKLVAKSAANRDFLRKFYPDFYEEAFPTARAAGETKGSGRRAALSAEPR